MVLVKSLSRACQEPLECWLQDTSSTKEMQVKGMQGPHAQLLTTAMDCVTFNALNIYIFFFSFIFLYNLYAGNIHLRT